MPAIAPPPKPPPPIRIDAFLIPSKLNAGAVGTPSLIPPVRSELAIIGAILGAAFAPSIARFPSTPPAGIVVNTLPPNLPADAVVLSPYFDSNSAFPASFIALMRAYSP